MSFMSVICSLGIVVVFLVALCLQDMGKLRWRGIALGFAALSMMLGCQVDFLMGRVTEYEKWTGVSAEDIRLAREEAREFERQAKELRVENAKLKNELGLKDAFINRLLPSKIRLWYSDFFSYGDFNHQCFPDCLDGMNCIRLVDVYNRPCIFVDNETRCSEE